MDWVLMGLLLVEDTYYNLKNKNEIDLVIIGIDRMMVDSYERYVELGGLWDWLRGDCRCVWYSRGFKWGNKNEL